MALENTVFRYKPQRDLIKNDNKHIIMMTIVQTKLRQTHRSVFGDNQITCAIYKHRWHWRLRLSDSIPSTVKRVDRERKQPVASLLQSYCILSEWSKFSTPRS